MRRVSIRSLAELWPAYGRNDFSILVFRHDVLSTGDFKTKSHSRKEEDEGACRIGDLEIQCQTRRTVSPVS